MWLGLLSVAAAAVTWGTTGSVLELIGASSAVAPVVGAVRMLVAAPLLVAGARLTGASLRPAGGGFAVAGLCMAGYQVCYFSAVPLAGVAATAVLAICSAPILVAVLARVVLQEPLTRLGVAATAVGVLGAGLLAGSAALEGGAGFLLGGALALGAGLAYSLYVVVTRSALAGAAPLGLSALTFALAAIVLLPVLAVEPAATAVILARGWPLLLYLGAVPTAGAYWLYTAGLARLPAAVAAVVGLLEPLTAALLGLALFQEPFGPLRALGAGLLLVAMGLLAVGTARGGAGG
jgi:DME family drug/metabolite transporter